MNLKYPLLILFVFINIHGFYMLKPAMSILKLNLILLVPPLMIIILKNDSFKLFLLWIFFALFDKLGKISLQVLPDITPDRIILVVIVLIIMLDATFNREKRMLPITAAEVAMVMLFMLCIFSMILSDTLYSKEGFAVSSFLNGFGIPYIIFFISKNTVNNEQRLKKLFIFLAIIGFYLGITGIFQYYRISYLIYPKYLLTYQGYAGKAAVGAFKNSTVYGLVIGIIILITIYLLQESRKGAKLFYLTSVIVMLVGLLFAYQRASWLGFLLSSLMIPVFLPKARKAFFVSLLIVIIVIATQFTADQLKPQTFTGNDFKRAESVKDRFSGRLTSEGSVYGRLTLYGVVWRMFLEKPVFGFGLGTYFEKSPKYFEKVKGIPYSAYPGSNLHDTMSGILVELGLAGLGLYLLILFLIFKSSMQLYLRLPPGVFMGKGLVGIFWGVFIVFLINTQFFQARLFLFPNALFFLIAGTICGFSQRISQIDEKHEYLLGE